MGEIRQVPCPMCGRAGGHQVVLKPGSTWRKKGVKNFWAGTAEFDPNKPFGVIIETTGRGTLRKVGTFGPEEDTEYFPFVKFRLLNVIKEWVAKGWVSQSDVAMAARGLIAPGPQRRPKKKPATS
jgi:hypothetical protein